MSNLSPLQFSSFEEGQQSLHSALSQHAEAALEAYQPQHDQAHVSWPAQRYKFGYPLTNEEFNFPERA